MFSAAELLVEGEQSLGQYNVEIARWSNDKWVSTVPPLYAMITNRRLILQPQTRKRYTPASIPGKYITDIYRLESERKVVSISLKTGYQINMFISLGKGDIFIEKLSSIALLIPQKEYNPPLP